MSIIKQIIAVLFIIFVTTASFESKAWDGYDFSTETKVSIHKGNTVHYGHEITVHTSTGHYYLSGTVESREDRCLFKKSIKVTVINYDTDALHTLYMACPKAK